MPTMPTPMPDDNYAQRTNHDYIGSFGRIPNEPKKGYSGIIPFMYVDKKRYLNTCDMKSL